MVHGRLVNSRLNYQPHEKLMRSIFHASKPALPPVDGKPDPWARVGIFLLGRGVPSRHWSDVGRGVLRHANGGRAQGR